MFERLGLAYAVVNVSDYVLDEQVDALQYLAILCLPPQTVFPGVGIPHQFHAKSVSVEQVLGRSFAGLEPFRRVEETTGVGR